MHFFRKLSDLLGINLLNESQKKLMLVAYIALLSQVISGSFINTFIFSSGGSAKAVIFFNIFNLASLTLSSLLQGFLVRRLPTVAVFRIGIISYMMLYIVILLLKDNISGYVWLAGILIGFSGALYYVTANVIVLSYSDNNPDAQNKYVGTSTVAITLTSIIVPFITGFVIQCLGNTGYYIVFVLSLVLGALSLVLSFGMPAVEKTAENPPLIPTLILLTKNKELMYVMYAKFFHGLREGSVGFIFYLMLFIMSPLEGAVGTFNSTMALIQSIGFYYITRRLTPQNAMKTLKIFVWAVFLSSLVFLFEINIYTLVFAGAAAYFFISFGSSSTLFMLSDAIKDNISAGFVLLEIFFSTGRTLGLLLLFFASGSIRNIGYAMIILAATQFLCLFLFSKAKKEAAL